MVLLLFLFNYQIQPEPVTVHPGFFIINSDLYARPPDLNDLKELLKQIDSMAGQDETTRKELLSVLSHRLDPPPIKQSPLSSIASIISGSVVRIGAVLVGIFLIQVVVGFARYYYKLAEHFRMLSVALTVSEGRLRDLKGVVPLMVPSNIEFGRVPNSPVERLADTALKTIGEVSKKISVK